MSKTYLYTEAPTTKNRIFAVSGDGTVSIFALKNHALMGRRNQKQQIQIQNQTHLHIPLTSSLVSHKHGEFACIRGNYYYRDLGSTNGTFLSGKLLKDKNEIRKLSDGDVLHINTSNRAINHPGAIALIFTTTFPGDPHWNIIFLNQAQEIHIGRSETNDGIAIRDVRVSKNHAIFFHTGAGWAITDRHSTNGVYLNGCRLENPVYLRYMDVVRVVNAYFVFLGNKILYCIPTIAYSSLYEQESAETSESFAAQPTPLNNLVVRIEERNVWQHFKKKTLLKDIRLTVKPGEMVLILGGSGAGKTTFMNAVMGYEKAQGKILHGNRDIYKEYEQMKYEIGFVPQQDLLRNSDTVYDTLGNAAKMKLPKDTPTDSINRRIKEVLTLLGLLPEQKNLVGKLSGGQRKRLSIAVEYISDPDLFFLDEPDSGLDGIMARSLFANLRTIANTGKIVMVISHGPDRAAELFDKVIVLAKDTRDGTGKLAFFGSVPTAKTFFETTTLEDIVRRINRVDEGGDGLGDHYIDKYKATGA